MAANQISEKLDNTITINVPKGRLDLAEKIKDLFETNISILGDTQVDIATEVDLDKPTTEAEDKS